MTVRYNPTVPYHDYYIQFIKTKILYRYIYLGTWSYNIWDSWNENLITKTCKGLKFKKMLINNVKWFTCYLSK